MADSTYFHLEQMLPELDDLKKKGIFNETEIKSIVKKRKDFEFAIHRRIAKKSDFLNYITYETNLDALRRKRKQRLTAIASEAKKKEMRVSVSDYSILKRIHSLYNKLLRKFGGEVELWVQYFSWAHTSGSTKALSKAFARAVQLHPRKEIFWIMSAKHEYDNGNMSSARVLFQRAIRMCDSPKVWIEYFKMEVLFAEKVKQRREILFGHESTPNKEIETESDIDADWDMETPQDSFQVPEEKSQNDVLSLAIPRFLYTCAIEKFSSFEFRFQLVEILKPFGDLTLTLQTEIMEGIIRDFNDNEDARERYARFLLSVDEHSEEYVDQLMKAIAEFERAVSEIPTVSMHKRFVSFVEEELKKATIPSLISAINEIHNQILSKQN